MDILPPFPLLVFRILETSSALPSFGVIFKNATSGMANRYMEILPGYKFVYQTFLIGKLLSLDDVDGCWGSFLDTSDFQSAATYQSANLFIFLLGR